MGDSTTAHLHPPSILCLLFVDVCVSWTHSPTSSPAPIVFSEHAMENDEAAIDGCRDGASECIDAVEAPSSCAAPSPPPSSIGAATRLARAALDLPCRMRCASARSWKPFDIPVRAGAMRGWWCESFFDSCFSGEDAVKPLDANNAFCRSTRLRVAVGVTCAYTIVKLGTLTGGGRQWKEDLVLLSVYRAS